MIGHQYHKIQTVYKRDPNTKYKTLLEGEWSIPEFGYLATNKWVYTEKVDGTNIRVIWNGSKVQFGGKTDNAQIPAFLVQRLIERFNASQFNGADLPEMTLYGEGYGARIQKGGGNYIPNDVDFVLFDVYCGMWLQRKDVEDIGNRLGIPVVPIIGEGTLHTMIDKCRNSDLKSTWGDFIAEGIVARPAMELLTRRGHRIITKIKCKDFV